MRTVKKPTGHTAKQRELPSSRAVCRSASRSAVLTVSTALFILLPAFDRDIFFGEVTNGSDKCACQTCIRNERNVMIDRRTADFVAVGQLPSRVIFRDIDDPVECMTAEHFDDVQFTASFVRPADRYGRAWNRTQRPSTYRF